MKITADMIENAAEEVGGNFRPRYSGRGMFGAECPAIALDYPDRIGVTRSIAEQIADDIDDDEEEFSPAELLDVIEDVDARMSSDHMGLGVIYYFRSVKS